MKKSLLFTVLFLITFSVCFSQINLVKDIVQGAGFSVPRELKEVNENLKGTKTTIYNLLGQKGKNLVLESSNTNHFLNKGIYLLEIENIGSKSTKKLIIN